MCPWQSNPRNRQRNEKKRQRSEFDQNKAAIKTCGSSHACKAATKPAATKSFGTEHRVQTTMRAHEFLGTAKYRPTREGARPRRGHQAVQRYRTVSQDEKQLDELDFMGMSPCTKDCSGHEAGYKWSKARGGVSTASQSDSFNRGAEIARAGY